MDASVLGFVRAALQRRSLDTPSMVHGSTDPMVARMLAALTATLADLRTRYPFRSAPPFVVGAGGEARGDAPSMDTDEVRVDRETVLLGMLWRFCEASGLDYAEDMASHEVRVARLAFQATRDAGRGTIAL